jgi:hypothetical protein
MSLFDWLGEQAESGAEDAPAQRQDPPAEKELDSEEKKAYNPTSAAAEDAGSVREYRVRESRADEKQRRLDAMMDRINRRYGQDTVRKGDSRKARP